MRERDPQPATRNPEHATRNPEPGTVITVGTFDGVHRGHRAILDRLREKATALGLPSVLVTFEPHPLEIVRPESAPKLLTTPAEKLEALAQVGLDRVVILRFDRRLAAYDPRRFVEDILLERLGMCHLVTGYDHGFGRNRSGDAALLAQIGAEVGFGVDVVDPVLLDGEPISSSRVRDALGRGDVVAAARGLARPYTLSGTVIRGAGRGRQLGFPTANIALPDTRKLLPAEGIYAVTAELDRGAGRGPHATQSGLLHLGPRPTFADARPTIELFAFDVDRDLYGETVRITFCAHIRPIERFASETDLVRAMEADRVAAEHVFATGGGACAEVTRSLQSMV
ncbi:MAG: bifunctional riboflavin kinase/FAD synthetase [Longimicrobiales bacterium]